jgi:hypothetical protein
MNTQLALQKFVRGLHRHLFHSMPNRGPREVDLSKLLPVQNRAREWPVIGMQFTERAQMTLNNVVPEPWDIDDQDR